MFCVLYACSVEKRKILKPGLVNQRINPNIFTAILFPKIICEH